MSTAEKKVSWEAYQQIQRMNPSTLVRGIKSMRSLKRQLDDGFVSTPAMEFGSQYHCLLLEPEEFMATHVVMPDFTRDPRNVTGTGKPSTSVTAWSRDEEQRFRALHSAKEIISQKNYDRALRMIESIRADAFASELLDQTKEVTLYGEIEGVPFKGRVDSLGSLGLADLKGTPSAAPIAFGRAFANLSYGFKMSIYRELTRQHCAFDPDVYVIACEKDGDYDCCVYPVPEIVLDNAYEDVLRVVREYKLASKLDVWPGVNRGKKYLDLHIPNWAMPGYDDSPTPELEGFDDDE